MSRKRDDPIFFPPVRVYECLVYTVCTTKADPDDRVSNYDFAFSGFGIKAKPKLLIGPAVGSRTAESKSLYDFCLP